MGLFGGGGDEPEAPEIEQDTLRSKDTVEVILAIAEGPIAGLKEGPQSFYLDNTALENESGDANFKNFKLEEFLGEVGDHITPALGGLSSSNTVTTNLEYDTP